MTLDPGIAATVLVLAAVGFAVVLRFFYLEWRFLRRRREWNEDMRRRFEAEKWQEKP